MDLSQLKVNERAETCAQHGDFVSRNFAGKHWSLCGKCREESDIAEQKAKKAQQFQDRINRMLLNSGLEGRFQAATFENYSAQTPEQVKVVKICQDYVQNFTSAAGGGLWLVGPPGTGKTHLGSAMVSAMIQARQIHAMIYSSREIIRMLRATWGQNRRADESTEQEVIDKLARVPLLIIDEIGVSFGSDSEHVQLFDVLDLRYKHARPTVLLSNLTTAELKQGLGDRAYDRLREGAIAVPCNWPSHRGNKDVAAMMQGHEWPEAPRGFV